MRTFHEIVLPMLNGVNRHVLIIFLGALLFTACPNGKPGREKTGQAAKSGTGVTVDFNAHRAFEHVRNIVNINPRYPGTPGIEAVRKYIEKELASCGLKPVRDSFTAKTPHPRFPEVQMANITADIRGEVEDIVIIGSHYDAKMLQNVDFQGANDSGSSTGLVLELADVFVKRPAYHTVRLAFFDGEESFGEWSDRDGLYGSKHYAAMLKRTGEYAKVSAVIIVDMIGDVRLRIPRDHLSTKWLVDHVWKTAADLGYSHVFVNDYHGIEDDHVPFRKIGISAVDIIDMNYGPGWTSNAFWHTAYDNVNNISEQSVGIVGRTVARSVYTLKNTTGNGRK